MILILPLWWGGKNDRSKDDGEMVLFLTAVGVGLSAYQAILSTINTLKENGRKKNVNIILKSKKEIYESVDEKESVELIKKLKGEEVISIELTISEHDSFD